MEQRDFTIITTFVLVALVTTASAPWFLLLAADDAQHVSHHRAG